MELRRWSAPSHGRSGVSTRVATGSRTSTAASACSPAGWGPSLSAGRTQRVGVADARVNLAPLGTEVVLGDVERWEPRRVDVVVADPPRAGLGARGVEVVAATGAERVALVSCDPASLARDSRGLVDAGYEVVGVELVDLFPHTHHLEAVTGLVRRS